MPEIRMRMVMHEEEVCYHVLVGCCVIRQEYLRRGGKPKSPHNTCLTPT